MQDRSCGVAHDDNSDTCPGSVSQSMIQKALPDLSSAQTTAPKSNQEGASHPESDSVGASRLIEFPGTTRSLPEWRKQVSQRVREVQERKAREAAEELAAAQEAGVVSCELPSGQLELVPDLEQPVLNPIVSKALERIDRARRTESFAPSYGRATAAAPALAAEIDDLRPEEQFERFIAQSKPKLTVVTPPANVSSTAAPEETLIITPEPEPAAASSTTPMDRKPVRLISENDPALSYLDTCLSVPALAADTRNDLPALSRRFIAGVLDLIFMALMVSPAAAALYYTVGNWSAGEIELLSGIAVATMFVYMTISIALTGRTLAMRMLSLKTIDLRTGLIPTGGQAIGRAFGFVFSFAILGLGQAYALIDPDRRTIYDRLSNTIVVRA